MLERRDDRDVMIVPARDIEARRLARGRTAALGRDEQCALHHFAAVERGGNAAGIAHHIDRAVGHAQTDILRLERGRAQRLAQQAVFEHDAERAFLFLGPEIEDSGLEAVAHADFADRAALPFEMPADADRLEHPPARARHRRDAAVKAGGDHGIGIGRIDHHRTDPVAVERDGERQPDQPAAEDDDVTFLARDLVHVPVLILPDAHAKARRRCDQPIARTGPAHLTRQPAPRHCARAKIANFPQISGWAWQAAA